MNERVLVFPEDVVVGSLAVHHRDAWLPRIPARGNVHVPADGVVHLASDAPVRGLGCLQADDLYSLCPQKKTATDTDMQRLAHLTGLRDLYCSKSRAITDAGLAHLGGLRQLRELDLYATRVSDAGLVHLAGMVHLRLLHLGLTAVKGPGLRMLVGLQRLERLSLEETDVDDAVVPHLAAMQSLKAIALWGTRMSTRGMAALQEALPTARISSRDTGHRLARERSRDTILRILARRLNVESAAPAEEALSRLLPEGSAIDWCLGGRSRRLWTRTDGFDTLALRLGAFFDFDLLVLTPDGRQRQIPWLRRRRSGRRVKDARRGGDTALGRQC